MKKKTDVTMKKTDVMMKENRCDEEEGKSPHEEAITIWEFMKAREIAINQTVYICLLSACSSVGALESGHRLHAVMVKSGIKLNVIMKNEEDINLSLENLGIK